MTSRQGEMDHVRIVGNGFRVLSAGTGDSGVGFALRLRRQSVFRCASAYVPSFASTRYRKVWACRSSAERGDRGRGSVSVSGHRRVLGFGCADCSFAYRSSAGFSVVFHRTRNRGAQALGADSRNCILRARFAFRVEHPVQRVARGCRGDRAAQFSRRVFVVDSRLAIQRPALLKTSAMRCKAAACPI